MYLRSVDLPDPLGPITPTSSPEWSVALSPCKISVLAAESAVAPCLGLGLRGEKDVEEEDEEAPGCFGSYPSPTRSTRTGKIGDRLCCSKYRVSLHWVKMPKFHNCDTGEAFI